MSLPKATPRKSLRNALSRRLTDRQIQNAIQTIRVQSNGIRWEVKKVASPRVWRFSTKAKAMEKAEKLAAESRWSIVIHDRLGRVRQTLPPPGKSVRAVQKAGSLS